MFPLFATAAAALLVSVLGLAWYARSQTRTHAAMREHTGHQPLVEHTDTPEP